MTKKFDSFEQLVGHTFVPKQNTNPRYRFTVINVFAKTTKLYGFKYLWVENRTVTGDGSGSGISLEDFLSFYSLVNVALVKRNIYELFNKMINDI